MLKYTLRILSIIAILLTGLAVMTPAAAQSCTQRTDWIPYRVAYGDTLFRVAVRYKTNVSTLAAGNCIGNINLIFVGQVLRVPPRPIDMPTPLISIPVTYQQFERGFMIWRTDTSDIWVYFGQAGGRVRQFAFHTYAGLPANPVNLVPPSGKIKPEFGFGRVWGNFPSIRSALGWATTHESTYIMGFSPTNSNVFYFTQPDGHAAVTVGFNLWGNFTGALSGAVSRTVTPAAYQPFQGGFLLWRADTGLIDEFHSNGYIAGGYSLDQYAHLSDTPIPDVPPAGLYKPVMGIGKVWTHFLATRDALGWATAPEQSYTATFVMNQGTFIQCVNLPDGTFFSYPHFDGARSYTWKVETTCG